VRGERERDLAQRTHSAAKFDVPFAECVPHLVIPQLHRDDTRQERPTERLRRGCVVGQCAKCSHQDRHAGRTSFDEQRSQSIEHQIRSPRPVRRRRCRPRRSRQKPIRGDAITHAEHDLQRLTLGRREPRKAVQHRCAELMETGVGELHLRLHPNRSEHGHIRRGLDEVLQQRRFPIPASPRRTKDRLCARRRLSINPSRTAHSLARPSRCVRRSSPRKAPSIDISHS
jgi:hypothetical protein